MSRKSVYTFRRNSISSSVISHSPVQKQILFAHLLRTHTPQSEEWPHPGRLALYREAHSAALPLGF